MQKKRKSLLKITYGRLTKKTLQINKKIICRINKSIYQIIGGMEYTLTITHFLPNFVVAPKNSKIIFH